MISEVLRKMEENIDYFKNLEKFSEKDNVNFLTSLILWHYFIADVNVHDLMRLPTPPTAIIYTSEKPILAG